MGVKVIKILIKKNTVKNFILLLVCKFESFMYIYCIESLFFF